MTRGGRGGGGGGGSGLRGDHVTPPRRGVRGVARDDCMVKLMTLREQQQKQPRQLQQRTRQLQQPQDQVIEQRHAAADTVTISDEDSVVRETSDCDDDDVYGDCDGGDFHDDVRDDDESDDDEHDDDDSDDSPPQRDTIASPASNAPSSLLPPSSTSSALSVTSSVTPPATSSSPANGDIAPMVTRRIPTITVNSVVNCVPAAKDMLTDNATGANNMTQNRRYSLNDPTNSR